MDPQCLTVLAAACRDHERVRFAYRGRDAAATRRDVEPHALVNLGSRWYLVAWDPARDAWRTFRVDRLTRPAAAGRAVHAAQDPGRRRRPLRVAQPLLGPQPLRDPRDLPRARGRRAPAPAAGLGEVQPLGEGTCEYRTGDDDLQWLAIRIAMAGADADFEVDGPPELRRPPRGARPTPRPGGRGRRAARRLTLKPPIDRGRPSRCRRP